MAFWQDCHKTPAKKMSIPQTTAVQLAKMALASCRESETEGKGWRNEGEREGERGTGPESKQHQRE